MKTRNCYKTIEITPFGDTYNFPLNGFILGNAVSDNCLVEGQRFLVYPKGTYSDNEVDSYILKLIQESNPDVVIEYLNIGTQAHPDLPDGIIPVHLTIRADGTFDLEGGVRPAIYGYQPWTDSNEPLAIAELCNIVILNDYISPPAPAC